MVRSTSGLTGSKSCSRAKLTTGFYYGKQQAIFYPDTLENALGSCQRNESAQDASFLPGLVPSNEGVRAYKPQYNSGMKEQILRATFSAGCFWGVEEIFGKISGVKSIMVGYTGGHKENPTYEEVCDGKTGHAEAVQVEYDPTEISYEDLLKIFWTRHDPTTHNRQGPDVGEQYRSVVFFHSEEQKRIAERVKREFEASGRFGRPIVTDITPVGTFWRAEEYHQKYFEKGGAGACHI